MNKAELRTKLKELRISASHYSLDGGLPNEKLCLNKEGDSWVVYYSERGVQSGKKHFSDEAAACEYFLYAIQESVSGKW